jgi:hypothetical protein
MTALALFGGPQVKTQPFPATFRGAYETIWVPQTALLGDQQDFREIAVAVRKL